MKGAEAEARVVAYLKQLGREIMARNYRIAGGEIDIVSREGEVLVFTEVRHRTKAHFGSALESITPRKLALMQRAALTYLMNELGHDDVLCRLEVATIDGEVRAGEVRLITLDALA